MEAMIEAMTPGPTSLFHYALHMLALIFFHISIHPYIGSLLLSPL